jgi:TPR repeat protein
LEFGVSVAEDLIRAPKFYRLSAEQGNARGHWNLGRVLESGHGVAQDFFCATELYRLAAERGIE